jgi:hypothetical protein
LQLTYFLLERSSIVAGASAVFALRLACPHPDQKALVPLSRRFPAHENAGRLVLRPKSSAAGSLQEARPAGFQALSL